MHCATCGQPTTHLINNECPPCFDISQAAWHLKVSKRIDVSAMTADKIARALLNQHWMHHCEIIPDYMPPFPREDTRPSVQIRYAYLDGTTTFLRYSRGPSQGYFWDIYGEDFLSPELALVSLASAPPPPRADLLFSTHGR